MVLLGVAGLASAGTWTPLANQPSFLNPASQCALYHNANCVSSGTSSGAVQNPLLMTDGTVLFMTLAVSDNGVDSHGNPQYLAYQAEYKLVPDANGSYVNGTWTKVATLPAGYVPVAFSSAVLADGRVIYEGGEYLFDLTTFNFNFLLTNLGAIYDPVADTWTPVPPPAFFVDLYPPRAVFAPNPIGEAANVVLPDGTFMLQDKMSRQAALLGLQHLTWTETGTSTKADMNNEEGLTLLPNGKVLTVDCYTDFFFGLIPSYPTNPTNSEIYDPQSGTWSSAGCTINTLTDPVAYEIGPAVLRPDGKVLATGSSGTVSIYDSNLGTWSVGPMLPISPTGRQCRAQDAPGALLPNGNVLVACNGGTLRASGIARAPSFWYEFDGTAFNLSASVPDGTFLNTGNFEMLVLPTGQILQVDLNTDVEIYTPADTSHNPAWEPVIKSVKSHVKPGRSYTIRGVLFNGMSQGAMQGDDLQAATNYPLVRITNLNTGHVFYNRTHDHSFMGVAATKKRVHTTFDVPLSQEAGPSKIEVVANGIPSKPICIIVKGKGGDDGNSGMGQFKKQFKGQCNLLPDNDDPKGDRGDDDDGHDGYYNNDD